MKFNDIFQDPSKFRVGSFLKDVAISDNLVKIEYYIDFNTVITNKTESKVSETDFTNYWKTGKSIEKMIVEPIRIMRDYQEVEIIEFIFGNGEYKYSIHIKKKEFEIFTNLKISDLSSEENWINFIDDYIYNLNNPKRKAFFEKFVQIEKINEN